MEKLREKLSVQIPKLRKSILEIIKEHKEFVISNVTIKQAYGGMRGVAAHVCNSSYVDPVKGIHLRGTPITELTDKKPEEIFYLLCTGELPNEEELKQLQNEFNMRAEVPDYVWDVIHSLPQNTHPMTMLSAAILSMEAIRSSRKNIQLVYEKQIFGKPLLMMPWNCWQNFQLLPQVFIGSDLQKVI